MKKSFLLLLSGIFYLGIFDAHPQDRSDVPSQNDPVGLSVQALTVAGGLPQGYVSGIVQDKQGFIWMGTKGGLVCYDGYQIKVFKNDPANSRTIASNLIQSLYLDRENNLWIIYLNHSADIFDPVTRHVKHILPDSGLGWLLAGTHLLHFNLLEDRRHRYWVVSSNLRRLCYFSWDQQAPIQVPVPDLNKIIAIQEDQTGRMWVCTDKTLYTVAHDGRHLDKVADLPDKTHYKDYRICQMVQDARGNWVIGKNGCVLIFTRDHHWKRIATPSRDAPVHFVVKAPDGQLYVHTGNRVFRLNNDYTLSLIWTNTNHPGDLQALMIDRSGVMWAGTDTFGARILNLSSRGFHSHAYRYGFIFDVLHALHFTKKQFPYWDSEVSYYVRSAKDAQGNLWFINIAHPDVADPVSLGRAPLYRWSKGKAMVFPIKTRSPGWLQFTFDQQGQCWGILLDPDSLHCHLVKVNPAAGTVAPQLSLNFVGNQVAYLTSVGRELCMVYSSAIQLYNPKTKASKIYPSKDFFGNASLLMAVADAHKDSILWVTSIGNGLLKFNRFTGAVKAFTEADNLPDNTVYAAVQDKQGYLWCSSNKGIFRFNPVDYSVLSFTGKDGLQGDEFNRYHFLEALDGKLFFGGTLGWTSFYPDSIHIDTYQPPTVLTGVLVNNTPINLLPEWKDSVITTMGSLSLSYQQNFLTFYFAGLEFNHVGKLPYRYRLDGIDKTWVDGGAANTAHYTNLPPGNYTFSVNAANTAGIWSNSIRTLQISILPPWWRRWWAYVCYVLVVLITGFMLYQSRIKSIRLKHQIILQEKNAEQLREIDEIKTRFFSNVTHELRTPLSLIIGPLQQIGLDKEATPVIRKKISGVQRNARHLLLLINQLLDLSKIEQGKMKVVFSRGDLGAFLNNNIKRFEEEANIKHITIHLDNRIRGEYNFDADKCQKILSNLLSNAIKFTPDGGAIQISLTTDHNHALPVVVMEIKDSGIGIPEDKLPKIFDRFYQVDDSSLRSHGGTGIGLSLVKELTDLMNGTIEAKSEPGKGSVFRISIPVKEALGPTSPIIQQISPEPTYSVSATDQPRHPENLADNKAPLILITEDNKELNSFITHTLAEDYLVLTAYNGREALEMAEKELPDLIISDIMMPEMDGYTLCDKIKSTPMTNHIAFILLSAKASHDSIIRGLRNYADDYITKPFYIDELQLRINNILDRQRKLRDYYHRQLTVPGEQLNTHAVDNLFMKQLYGIIQAHLDDSDLDVGKLAEYMNISRRTLNRKLSAMINLSAHDIIRQYRLKQAAILLKNKLSVTETAYSVGFESPSYFSVAFKAFYGIPPSEYSSSSMID